MGRVAQPALGSDSVTWATALELYFDDKVVASLDVIEPNSGVFGGGVLGTYRMIEGEARTRRLSERAWLAPWLEFEWISHELHHAKAAGTVILDAATKIGARLRWDRREKVLATVLTAEADADWHEARYGYCVDKTPYDKICLPLASCETPEGLWQVAAHEFTHVIILNATLKTAPHWLDEGIACLMEGRSVVAAKARLDHNRAWRPVAEMRGAFDPVRTNPENMPLIRAAYDQGLVLAAYLHSLKGDAGLVDLLNAFAERPSWSDIVMRLTNHEPIEQALRHVHGFGEEQLFRWAADWRPHQ